MSLILNPYTELLPSAGDKDTVSFLFCSLACVWMTGAQEMMKIQIVAIYKVTHKSYTLCQPKQLLQEV